MPLVDTDPFILVYRKIKRTLMDFPDLNEVVRRGNFVWFDQYKLPPKVAQGGMPLQPADAPEIRLEQGQFKLDVYNFDGNTVEVTQDYPLVVTSADHHLIPPNLVKWQVLRALVSAGHYLGFVGLVLGMTLEDSHDKPNPFRAGRQAQGAFQASSRGSKSRWITLLDIKVRMVIRNEWIIRGVYDPYTN